MRLRFARGGRTAIVALRRSLGVLALSAASAVPALAEPFEYTPPFPAMDEFRVGVFAANLEGGGSEEGDYVINGELLFGRLEGSYGDPILDHYLRPRPHIGVSLATDEGTNQAYAGLTWDIKLTDRIFVETSFGGVLHDGPTDSDDPDSYGCSLLFRESASLGFALSPRARLLLTVDHISNAGLCDQNQGLTNAGVRLGYRW